MNDKTHHSGAPEFHIRDGDHDRSRQSVVRRTRIFTLAMVVLLCGGLGWSLLVRWKESKALEARAADSGILHVRVVEPGASRAEGQLTLPATLQGVLEAQIYARANGYVKEWLKDIGAPVKKGEVLAILDLPEVKRQVDQAEANFQLARSAYERWKLLRADDAVSQQELDEKTAAYRQTEGALKQVREQLAFGQVVAPFDGVVTRRTINVGDLVSAGSSNTSQPLFAVAQTDRLHAYIYVPQDQAGRIAIGNPVELVQTERPDQPIKGTVARTAGAIDTNTRTLQVDIDIPNPGRVLLPGSYVQVGLKVDGTGTTMLPTNTLLFGAAGPQVAVVRDGKAQRQDVMLGTDYGRMVAIKSGIAPGDKIIVNPPDSIADGQAVQIEAVPQENAAGGGKKP